MEAFWFWILLVLVVFAIFAWPAWPYTRDRGIYRRRSWGYAPSVGAAGIFLLLMVMFWLGLIVVWWPWAAYA